jgi:hypothetical protein
MQLPSDTDLQQLSLHHFSNEIEVQRFIEDHVLGRCGLRSVGSSVGGRGRIGFIDTLVINSDSIPFIIEYKWDLVDDQTIRQVVRYRDWLLNNADRLRSGLQGWTVDLTRLCAITVGHRYHPSCLAAIPTDLAITFWRYGHTDAGTAFLRDVKVGQLRNGMVGAPAPRTGKEHYLEEYRQGSTRAASQAFDALRRELNGLGLSERILGKRRIRYSNESVSVTVSFGSTALLVSFSAAAVIDPDGRVFTSPNGKCSVGVATESDVGPTVVILKGALPIGSGM